MQINIILNVFKAGSVMYMHKCFKCKENKTCDFSVKTYIGLLGLIFQAFSTKQ